MPRKPKRRFAKKDEEEEDMKKSPYLKPEAQRGILIIVFFALGLLSVLSLFNLAGSAGSWIAYALLLFFGWGKFLFPIIVLTIGCILLYPSKYQISRMHYVGLALFVFTFFGFLHLFVPYDQIIDTIPKGAGGGYFGLVLSFPLQKFLGVWASGIVLFSGWIIAVILILNTSLSHLVGRLGGIHNIYLSLREKFSRSVDDEEEGEYEGDESNEDEDEDKTQDGGISDDDEPSDLVQKKGGVQTEMPLPPKRIRRKIDIPFSLLSDRSEKPTSGDTEAGKERIKQTLENFGIEVTMHEVNVGPTVTQYTLKPADGVKLSRIVALQKDLALALAAHPIRIEAPIPGKSLVGVEVPNQSAAIVRLKELLKSPQFKKRKSSLALPLGKDVSGQSFVAYLDNMPHMLIAGATGSGKSVCINTIIISLLYQNSPNDLRFILVDPKRVELSVYNDIPYLLTPVITDYEKTINALKWAVAEMDRRYELLSQYHKRNIYAYNESTKDKLPYIVIIVDELADLMAVAARDIEGIVIRLAQMARAVGIHLILATQRPSVDVLTGLIKANITTRLAFNVASAVDSRTILDFQGAEKLLGKGDMLYVSADFSKPRRLQGAFLSDEEISNVAEYLKGQGEADYTEEIVKKHHKAILPGVYQDSEQDDELLEEAKDVIIKSDKASASLLQRRLRIGYARAARILDILEEQGIIGPADGAKPREVLITADEAEDLEKDDSSSEDDNNDENDTDVDEEDEGDDANDDEGSDAEDNTSEKLNDKEQY